MNTIPVVAQHAGFNLTSEQIAFIITAGGTVVRWLHLEIPFWISGWKKVGGFAGLKAFLTTGKLQS